MQYDVVILGAGITGLIVAYELNKKGYKVLVLEKEKEVGGLLRSVKIRNYFIEAYYHHMFPDNKNILCLIKELGLIKNLIWKKSSIAFLFKDRFFELSKPSDLIKFRPLTFYDKIKFISLMLKIKLIKGSKKFDNYYAKNWIIENSSYNLYKKLFEPLLKSKFGNNLNKISALWFIERIKIRSKGGLNMETLGYLKGGFQQLINKLVTEITKSNSKIKTEMDVKKVILKNNEIKAINYNNQKVRCRCVVSTIPPVAMLEVFKLPKNYKKKLEELEYQGSICILLGLNKNLTNYYWTNLIIEGTEFGAIIEHTNLINPNHYNQDNIVYLASYPNNNSKIWEFKNQKIFEIYFNSLRKIFPKLKEEDIKWWRIFKDKNTSLIYKKGILSKILGYKTPITNLFIGGMFNSYPERTMDLSIKKGKDLANLCIETFEKIEKNIKKPINYGGDAKVV